MAAPFRKISTRAVPANAEIVTDSKGRRFARWKQRSGKTIKAELSADGTRCTERSANYYGRVHTADGPRIVPLCSDLDASREMLREKQRRADREKAGLVDPFAEQWQTALAEHLADFRRHLQSAGNSPKHVTKIGNYVERILHDCEFRRLADICHPEAANRVEDYLHRRRQPIPQTHVSVHQAAELIGRKIPGKLRKSLPKPCIPAVRGQAARWEWSKMRAWLQREFECSLPAQCPLPPAPGLSIAGSNDYLAAVKNFANWLVRSQRIPSNPFARLRKLNAAVDRRHVRREAAADEFSKLLEATAGGKPFRGLTGPDRVMLYIVATASGLRASELGSLTVGSIDFDSEAPSLTVEAAYSKRRRMDVQPIHPELAAMLRNWLQSRARDEDGRTAVLSIDGPSQAKLWPGNWPEKGAVMLRRDLQAAGIPYKNDRGEVLDFHALRHTFGSNLSRAGVSPKLAQELMRHSDINLTMGIYTHVRLSEMHAALDALPRPPAVSSAETSQATGTDE